MARQKYKPGISLGGRAYLAASACLLLGLVPAQDQPSPQEQELRRQLQTERAALKALSYQADMRKAAQLAEAEEWPRLRTLLDQYRAAPGEAALRFWEWHFLDSLLRKKQLVDRQELALQGPAEGTHQLAWSGNGERLAAVGEDGSVVIWDVASRGNLPRAALKQTRSFWPGVPTAAAWRCSSAGRPRGVSRLSQRGM
jgi:hypothetical protein